MLKGDFYNIENLSIDENAFEARVSLNPEHAIFSGHFPGQPILPGATLIQMVEEIISQVTGKELLLTSAKNIKFLHPVNPQQIPEFSISGKFTMEHNDVKMNARAFEDETVIFKFQGNFESRN